MPEIVLIIGGARSGKSTLALEYAEKNYKTRAFIASATAVDKEMKQRIESHQKKRRGRYLTVEEERDLVAAIKKLPEGIGVAVVDCLTVWLGNLFYHANNRENSVKKQVDTFVRYLSEASCSLILVTNEVGCGIVPDNEMSRMFRDISGYMNRKIAQKADTVYLCTCGIPIKVK